VPADRVRYSIQKKCGSIRKNAECRLDNVSEHVLDDHPEHSMNQRSALYEFVNELEELIIE